MGKIRHPDVVGDRVTETQWEADSFHLIDDIASLSIVRSATVIVSASDSSAQDKAQSDFICGSDAYAKIIEALAAFTSGTFLFLPGTYTISAYIPWSKSDCLVMGYGAEFKRSATTELFVVSSCDRATFRGFKLNGSSLSDDGFRITSGTSNIWLDDLEITSCDGGGTYGGGAIRASTGGTGTIRNIWVTHCYIHDNPDFAGVLATTDVSYIYVDHNIFDTNAKSVIFDTSPSYGRISYNLMIYDGGMVHLESATNIDVIGNVGLNSSDSGSAGLGAEGVGILADGASDRHRIYHNTVLNAGDDGIQTASEGETGYNYVKDAADQGYSISPHGHPYSMIGDTAESCDDGGFMFQPSGDNLVYTSLRAIDNTGFGIRSDTCDDSTFVNPYSTGSTYGFYSGNGGLRTNILGGYLGGNTNAITLASGSTLNRVRNVLGYVTENSGTSSITSGQTTKVVAHGLATTPTRIDINFREQGTSDYGRWWVDTIGATNFTLNVSADPGASNLDFAWRAEVY